MDDRMNNPGFGAGFMADMLKDLQKQYEIDKKPKGKGKRGKSPEKLEKNQGKPEGLTAMPADRARQGAVMPGIHMMHVTESENPRAGDVLLDTYRVESDAIKGGMGAVWRVHHTGWDVDLAMKRPHPEAFRTEAQKKKFTDECQFWMNLGLHPNIVSCYYVREIGGIPTIFSEWMENGSLESHIKDGTLYKGTKEEVQERLLDIAIQFARGLHYAHENDLIHQDVKPDNLLLTEGWTAKVSDFGLAKARTMLTFLGGTATELETDENATIVTPGGGMTPAYCSPEQAAAQLLTRRTDIYSWAVSVLEMYLGDKPWAHGRVATGPLVGSACWDYFNMCVERPVPKALQELLAKCMEMNPDDRPHDFSEVEEELHKIYKTGTGTAYLRPEPKAAADTADSLNNRALSYLDLGKPEEAEALWETAMKADMHNLHTIYNQGLWQWRKGEITDEELLRRLLQAKSDQKEAGFRSMMAHIHLERGDGAAALSFLSEDGDETLRETAHRLSTSKEKYESRFRTCPFSGCEILDAALVPQQGKMIQQVLTKDKLMRIVLWDLEGEAEPCILDERHPESTIGLMNADFTMDDSGNHVAARFGYSEKEHEITVWDLRESKVFNTYTVQAMGILGERHKMSPDGRWLAVTWFGVNKLFGDSINDFYCIHENGIVSQDKPDVEKRICHSLTYLFEMRSGSILRRFYTLWRAEWPMFTQDNKLLFKPVDTKERTVIIIDPVSLQSEKRCLSDREPVYDWDAIYLSVQPSRGCKLQSSALSPNGNILVRRFWQPLSQALKPNIKIQFIHVPTGRCMATFEAGRYSNDCGNSVFTSDGKGVFSPGEEPVVRAVPQWIYRAPMMPSFIVSIGRTHMAFETEREYEYLIREGERHFAAGHLNEALSCVDRAWSLREPDERLAALNCRLGQLCTTVGIRRLRKVGSFPHFYGDNCNMKETPLFSRDGSSFVTKISDRSWQKFDAKTLLPLSQEVGFQKSEAILHRFIEKNPSSALSLDGRFLFVDYRKIKVDPSRDSRFGIKQFDLVTGQTIELLADDHRSYEAPLLSPAGDVLYCNCSTSCYAFSTLYPGMNPLFHMELPEDGNKRLPRHVAVQKVLSSDGKRMYCASFFGSLWAYDIESKPQKLFEAGYSKSSCGTIDIALSPDDKWLCILREDNQIELLDAGNGELIHIFPTWQHVMKRKYKECSLGFSPDGNLLLLFLEDSIVTYDLKNREVRGAYRMYDWVGNAVFAPDGRMFAISPESDGIIYEVDYLYHPPDDFPE